MQGTLTLRMTDVPWRDALDTAVEALGFVVAERNAGILVITTKHAVAK